MKIKTPIMSITEYKLHKGKFVLPANPNPIKTLLIIGLIAVALFYVSKILYYPRLESANYVSGTIYHPELEPVDKTALRIANYVHSYNSQLGFDKAMQLATSVLKWSREHKIDPVLFVSLIQVESSFKPYAISHAGAFGLSQIIPKWHLSKIQKAKQDVGTPELFDIEANIYIGTLVLAECKERQKDTRKALLCYNGSLNNDNGYADKVMSLQTRLKSLIST